MQKDESPNASFFIHHSDFSLESHAIRQLVSKAIAAEDEFIDVFTAAGIKRPDISILSLMKSSSPKSAA